MDSVRGLAPEQLGSTLLLDLHVFGVVANARFSLHTLHKHAAVVAVALFQALLGSARIFVQIAFRVFEKLAAPLIARR